MAFQPNYADMRFISDYPSHGALRFPSRPAIIGDQGSLTYQELDEASNRFCQWLKNQGYAPGTRIAYLDKNSELMFPALFGSIRAGCVLVPINWRFSPGELAYVTNDADAALLIHGPDLTATVAAARDQLNSSVQLMSTVEAVGDMPALTTVLRQGPAPTTPPALDPDLCMLQLYTSGTTGKPKGVMLSHRAVSIARWVEIGSPDWADWTDDDVILSGMPNFHAGGLGWMLTGLLRSLTCVLTADPSASNLLALSKKFNTTRTFIVPSVVRMLLDELDATQQTPPGIRSIFYGAAPMDPALIERCFKTFGRCTFGNYYGMTEASGTISFLPPSGHDVNRPELLRSVGRALPDYQLQIRDPKGQPLAPNQHGEVWVKTDALMSGYWKLPDATQEVLQDGWYRTGDGGYLNEEGYLFLTDRIKDMIITGGENVYPIEVEQVLRQHPAVQEIVVVGVPDEKWGEAVCAVIEWRPGQSATLDELREFARPNLAAYKLPKLLQSMAVLPRTATGKLQRAEVRKQFR
ncbi:MAG TPA: long-chain-fatty-acid--CoA ligase [Macromonas sp.]|nr:long-chain-fatty-acid--CoA ligase [Macromonas sp.]